MYYDQLRRATQNSEFRRVVISEVNMNNRYVLAKDQYERDYQISFDFHSSIVDIPDVGEIWFIKSYGNEWRLDKQMESGDLSELNPGDKKLEAANDLHLNSGAGVFINGQPYSSGISGIDVRKNSTGTVLNRSRLNFIEGDNIALTVADDATDSEIDVTVAAVIPPISTYPSDGWFAAGETWTYASTDAVTFTFTVAGDLTTKYAPGQRIKLTQATGGTKYFIVTAVAHAGGTTTVTIYGGTNYALNNEAITSPFFSREKAPFGFPLNPLLWRHQGRTDTNQAQSNTAANTWYNVGGNWINVPIGAWRLGWSACFYVDSIDHQQSIHATLSTANNSQSDFEFTAHGRMIGNTNTFDAGGFPGKVEKFVVLTTKTTYYFNLMHQSAANSSIWILGASQPTILYMECAYL